MVLRVAGVPMPALSLNSLRSCGSRTLRPMDFITLISERSENHSGGRVVRVCSKTSISGAAIFLVTAIGAMVSGLSLSGGKASIQPGSRTILSVVAKRL